MTEPTPPPKWQPDPFGRHEYRWWDGDHWTEHVSDGGVAATDPTTPEAAAPVIAKGWLRPMPPDYPKTKLPPKFTASWWGITALWVGALAIFAGLGIAGAVGGSGDDTSPPAATQPTRVHLPRVPQSLTVTYELTGSARSADITYQTPSGSSQQTGVDVPLVTRGGTLGISFEFPGSATFLYLSAQNNGGGSITCWIKVDGTTVSTNTARGSYAIATCQF